MTDFYFTLSAEDTDRIFAIKALQGREDLTANQFAQLLLERELRRLFPVPPKYDEEGRLLNPDDYHSL